MLFAILSVPMTARAAEEVGTSILQMDKSDMIIFGELRRGGLIDRLNTLEAVLFGRSLPGSISERQQALLSFIQDGNSEQPSLLFKIGVAEWAVSQSIAPSVPALARIQKLEQDLEGTIQEGKPLSMRVERLLTMLLADPVTQVELELTKELTFNALLLETIGPGKSRKGDSVRVELAEDVIAANNLIAPKGSRVITEVSEVIRPGAFGRPGEVKLELKYLEILGAEKPKVTLVDTRKDGDKGEKNIAAAAGASMFAAILLGPLGLATGLLIRGDALNVESGAPITMQFPAKTRVSAFPLPEGLRRPEPEPEKPAGGKMVIPEEWRTGAKSPQSAAPSPSEPPVQQPAQESSDGVIILPPAAK